MWICCQLGAREHYAIPRALDRQDQLNCLITDAWVDPQSKLNLLPKFLLPNLRERFHPELELAQVKSFNKSLINFEILHKIKPQNNQGWSKVIARNQWFQKQVISQLERDSLPNNKVNLFAYSYAALDLFKFAKKRGWKTFLGQIDPGILEEKLVIAASKKYSQYQSSVNPAPQEYWSNWQQECSLADTIIVNSHWSKEALQKTGIPGDKIKIIPLAYKSPTAGTNFTRVYPTSFSKDRPLRILFLGQIILRKGIAEIFKAIEILKDEPVEFWFVGSVGIVFPEHIKNNQQVKLIGKVPRSTTAKYYQQADIFLFPTLSDGFGLTQLEAQAWQLPIIASKFCGTVVKDRINGLTLPKVTAEAIANAINFCLINPELLAKLAIKSSHVLSSFSISELSKKLQLLD